MIFESQFETYFNDFVINSKFLNDEPSIIYFIVDEINNPHQIKLKQRLIQIIQASKKKKKISQSSIAASNSMTILNASHMSFSNMDLSNIHIGVKLPNNKWQGPNLMGGVFHAINFTGADLRGAMFQNC